MTAVAVHQDKIIVSSYYFSLVYVPPSRLVDPVGKRGGRKVSARRMWQAPQGSSDPFPAGCSSAD